MLAIAGQTAWSDWAEIFREPLSTPWVKWDKKIRFFKKFHITPGTSASFSYFAVLKFVFSRWLF